MLSSHHNAYILYSFKVKLNTTFNNLYVENLRFLINFFLFFFIINTLRQELIIIN